MKKTVIFTIDELVQNDYEITFTDEQQQEMIKKNISTENYLRYHMELDDVFNQSELVENIDYIDSFQESIYVNEEYVKKEDNKKWGINTIYLKIKDFLKQLR